MNEQDSTVSFFRFEDLRIYAKAMDYITWLYNVISTLPDDSAIRTLKESFLKSAQNIALNTAEGSSRSKTQFLYYLKMSKSSVRECVVFTEIMTRKQLFGEEETTHSRNQLMELTKMIGSLIASLQRGVGTSSRDDRDEDLLDPMPDINNF